MNQIHPVPVPFGASVWVLPAGNVTGQQGVPDRCQSEQAATLRRDLAKAPSARRIRLLSAQGRYLEYMRYLAHHPEGVCAAWVPAGANRITAGATFGCATLPDFLRWGILAVATARLHGAPVFWTVVPDPVASLTLRFGDSGRPRQLRVVPFFNVVVAQEIPSLPTRLTLRSANGRVIRSEAVNGNQLTLCGYGC